MTRFLRTYIAFASLVAIYLFWFLAELPHLDAQQVSIGPVAFLGSGLNDATSGGVFTASAANEIFVVTVSATGTPDHFTWTKNGGTASSPVAITGSAQSLADGVTIRFAATTGHSLGDIWTIDTTASGSSGAMTFVQAGAGAKVTRDVQSKLRETVSVADFGAKFNGSDDAPAWQRALASLLAPGHKGGTVTMPGNVISTVSGIVINSAASQYIRIVGQGNSSVIQCTGVACVAWSGVAAQGSGMQDLTISDPVGNSSTIGLYLDGGGGGFAQTNLRFSNMRILGNVNLQSGGHFAGLGVGVSMHNTILPRFDNVDVAYFDKDVLQTGFVNSFWFQSYMYGAGSRGWDVESTGDNYAMQCDIEGNTVTGIYLGTTNKTTVIASHFETNGNHFEVNGSAAQLISSGNNYEAGTELVDSGGAVFSSQMDDFGAGTLTNNSTGGGSGMLGATVKDSIAPPAFAGTGCGIHSEKGSLATIGTGCGALGLTFSAKGFASYAFDAPLSGSVATGSSGNPSTMSIDLNTSSTTACHGFVSKVSAYSASGNPVICWNSASGGFDFFPTYAIGGGVDYNFRGASGGSIGSATDGGTWTFPRLILGSVPTSCSGQPSGTVYSDPMTGHLILCP